MVGPVHCSQDPQIRNSAKKKFKTGSHMALFIFKNYFAVVFSIFSNKQYPNRPLDFGNCDLFVLNGEGW